jgi:two-component sensor histidine kinase
MSLVSRVNKLVVSGVKPGYLPWEKYLTRKLNYYTLISILAEALAILAYISIHNYNYIVELSISLLVFPLVIICNKHLDYKYALYLFYLNATGIVFFVSLKMGGDSEILLFFFPLTISLLTLLNRKEMNMHIRVLMGMMVVLLFTNLIGFKLEWFQGVLSAEELNTVRIFNIFFCSFITLLFSIALSKQNAMQENELMTLVKEKETLLAEVHHRVKNNMAIISSLLNLKKEASTSTEAKEVLEDSKNRIYSMALIHKNIYGNKSFKSTNFHTYITELAEEMVGAYTEHKIKLSIDAKNCILDLDTAIPCGLIINELLTNSLKYALPKTKELTLTILMKKTMNHIRLSYSDNGPGILPDSIVNNHSLGMTLIDLLSQQLEAKYTFKNEGGLVFNMNFTLAEIKA